MDRCVLAVVVCVCLLSCGPMMARGETPAATGAPAEDEMLPALRTIAGEGMLHSHAFEFLTELSDDIGGRVTGTPQAAKAIEWGAAKMKSLGLENVRAEKWRMSRGWTRGPAVAEILAPTRRKLTVDSLGWVGSTPAGGVEANLFPFNVYDFDREMQDAPRWAGKVLFVIAKGTPTKDGLRLFAQFGSFLEAARKAGALAVIGGQGGMKSAGMHLTHTGALGFDKAFEIPVVNVTAEDQAQIERFLDRGKTVRVRINVQNQLTAGPVESANMVGEIRGTEHPEQVVVVGAHLDSWDLAEGTTDNGTGSASVLGAAEAIAKSGFRPKRTIRFVLFTGEEQGLLGSFAYVKQHEAEMAEHLGCLVLDTGQGPVKTFNLGGHADLLPAFEKFAETLRAFGAVNADDEAEFGTDTGPFILAGLPGINLMQDSPEYKYTHHSAGDTLEAVKPDVLVRNATLMALAAYWIADRPERLASPWPREKTAKMLVDKHEDTFLKAFGIWPFGDQ